MAWLRHSAELTTRAALSLAAFTACWITLGLGALRLLEEGSARGLRPSDLAIDVIGGSEVSLQGLFQGDSYWFDNDLVDLNGADTNDGKDQEFELRRAEVILVGKGVQFDWQAGYDAKARALALTGYLYEMLQREGADAARRPAGRVLPPRCVAALQRRPRGRRRGVRRRQPSRRRRL